MSLSCSLPGLNTSSGQALHQVQLFTSNVHTHMQMLAHYSMSASARLLAQMVARPRQPALKEPLQKIGKNILILCTPWPSWTISGSYIVGALDMPVTGKITVTDDAGRKILSYFPVSIEADFLSATGQGFISHLNFTARFLH